jgi:hypothetical protein
VDNPVAVAGELGARAAVGLRVLAAERLSGIAGIARQIARALAARSHWSQDLRQILLLNGRDTMDARRLFRPQAFGII